MKHFDPVAWVIATPVSFSIFLLLKSAGPLSDGNSFTDNAVASLVMALTCGTFLSWSSRRSDDRQQRAVVLDTETTARVDDLLSKRKRAQAVTVVREATGADLQTARDTVETRRAQTSRLRYLGL